MKIEGAWESRKGMKQGRPYLVQQSLEGVNRGSIDDLDREFIQRYGKPHQEGCFAPEQTEPVPEVDNAVQKRKATSRAVW